MIYKDYNFKFNHHDQTVETKDKNGVRIVANYRNRSPEDAVKAIRKYFELKPNDDPARTI